MTTQYLADLALARWNELRKQGLAPKERLADPELQQYEQDLEVIRKCMERRT